MPSSPGTGACDNILNERSTAGTALDVESECAGTHEFAMLNADVTDAAGGFAADADAGEDGVRKRAVGDVNVLRGLEQSVGFHAAAGFE